MIRLAVIGFGAWGSRYAPSAAEAGNCIVTHVAGSGESREYLHRIPSREWRRLIDAPVDAFVVATPPDARVQICCELLMRGRPVMVEKPLALDVTSANTIEQCAEASGAPLLVAHQHVFAPAYEELRERCSGWRKPYVTTRGGGPGPLRSYSALWDYGPHDVSMFLGMVPNHFVETAHWEIESAWRRRGLFGALVKAGKHLGEISVWNDSSPKSRHLTVSGGDGLLSYDDLDEHKLRFNGRPVAIPPERPLARALRAFADAAQGAPRDYRFRLGAPVVELVSDIESMLCAEDPEDSQLN